MRPQEVDRISYGGQTWDQEACGRTEEVWDATYQTSCRCSGHSLTDRLYIDSLLKSNQGRHLPHAMSIYALRIVLFRKFHELIHLNDRVLEPSGNGLLGSRGVSLTMSLAKEEQVGFPLGRAVLLRALTQHLQGASNTQFLGKVVHVGLVCRSYMYCMEFQEIDVALGFLGRHMATPVFEGHIHGHSCGLGWLGKEHSLVEVAWSGPPLQGRQQRFGGHDHVVHVPAALVVRVTFHRTIEEPLERVHVEQSIAYCQHGCSHVPQSMPRNTTPLSELPSLQL